MILLDVLKQDYGEFCVGKVDPKSVWSTGNNHMFYDMRVSRMPAYGTGEESFSLVSDRLLQVEIKQDRNIDGENKERENNR